MSLSKLVLFTMYFVLFLASVLISYYFVIMIALSILVYAWLNPDIPVSAHESKTHKIKSFQRALRVLIFASILICGSIQITISGTPDLSLGDLNAYVIWWVENLSYSSASLEYYSQWKENGHLRDGLRAFLTINILWVVLCTTIFLFSLPMTIEVAKKRSLYQPRNKKIPWPPLVFVIIVIKYTLVLTILFSVTIQFPWLLYFGNEAQDHIIEYVRYMWFIWIIFSVMFFVTLTEFCYTSAGALKFVEARG